VKAKKVSAGVPFIALDSVQYVADSGAKRSWQIWYFDRLAAGALSIARLTVDPKTNLHGGEFVILVSMPGDNIIELSGPVAGAFERYLNMSGVFENAKDVKVLSAGGNS